jgi:hypothetical protein
MKVSDECVGFGDFGTLLNTASHFLNVGGMFGKHIAAAVR